MSLFNLRDDSINKALMTGLTESFRGELKKILMDIAEKEVDIVVEKLSKQVEVNASTWLQHDSHSRYIKLEWLLKKEGE